MGKNIVFLDRDGVINKKAADHHYISRVEDFMLNDGIFDLLSQYNQDGFEFIVITNQRGIARGLFTENDLDSIHKHMAKLFFDNGIKILDIFYCPHNIDSCECRKPKPGLLQQAVEKYDINLEHSILISDSLEDAEMGEHFGIGENIYVKTDTLASINR